MTTTKSRQCTVCGETHLLRPNGLMSIHYTASGERCEEPEARRHREREAQRADPEHRREVARRKAERDEAYAAARGAKRGSAPQRTDRSIYANRPCDDRARRDPWQ